MRVQSTRITSQILLSPPPACGGGAGGGGKYVGLNSELLLLRG